MITKITIQLYELAHDLLNNDRSVRLPGGTRFALFPDGQFWQVRWGLSDKVFCMFLTCETKLDPGLHRLRFEDLSVNLWQAGSVYPSMEMQIAQSNEIELLEADSCSKIVQTRIVPSPAKQAK